MRLEAVMQMIKKIVDRELARFFEKKRKEAARIHPSVVELVDQVADVTLRGGKRIRPFLCWLGYHSVIASEARQSPTKTEIASSPSAPRNDKLMHAMMGLELFQTFALIHDDIMDESAERRGGPSVHAQMGISMAILAGDLALTWADEEFSRSLSDNVVQLYQRMKEEVIYGQTLDIVGGEKHKADELKTAYYSVVRPLQTGSAIALSLRAKRSNLSSEGIAASYSPRNDMFKQWEDYGIAVGRLFQLRDDVLDDELTEQGFETAARPLQERALTSLKELTSSDEVKQLLIDFVQFVQNS